MVRVQAVVGGRFEGIYKTMVELVRLHHAIPIPHHHKSPLCGLSADRVWQIRASGTREKELAIV